MILKQSPLLALVVIGVLAGVLYAAQMPANLPAPGLLAAGDASQIRKIMETARPATALVTFSIQTDDAKLGKECWGVVVSADGLVMVSADNFEDKYAIENVQDIKVQLELDKPKTLDAEFVGKDESTGVAMLKIIPEESGEKFAFVKFSSLANIDVGDEVLVVGHMGKDFSYKRDYRLGRVTATLTRPIKQFALTPSAMHQNFGLIFLLDGTPVGVLKGGKKAKTTGGRRRGGYTFFMGPRPGASGGGILLLYPAVNFAKLIADPPKAGQKKIWLGVQGMQDLTKDLAEVFGLKEEKGVIIGHVIPEGPGETLGLKAQDIILMINGKKLESDVGGAISALTENLKKASPGDKVTFTIYRDGAQIEVIGLLQAEPKRAALAKKVKFEEKFNFGVRELVFFDLHPRDLAKNFKGCIVHFLKPGWASDGKLKKFDIVTKIGDDKVMNVDHFKSLFDAACKVKAREIILTVLRGRSNTSVVVRIECHWK